MQLAEFLFPTALVLMSPTHKHIHTYTHPHRGFISHHCLCQIWALYLSQNTPLIFHTQTFHLSEWIWIESMEGHSLGRSCHILSLKSHSTNNSNAKNRNKIFTWNGISLILGPDIMLVFLLTGSAKERPMNHVTAKLGRCGFRKSLTWNQKSVSMFSCILCSNHLDKFSEVLFLPVQKWFWTSRIFISVFFHFSGRCKWGVWRCCQLPVVTHQLQILCQLQISHSEEWGL